jgi:hypothetical protein
MSTTDLSAKVLSPSPALPRGKGLAGAPAAAPQGADPASPASFGGLVTAFIATQAGRTGVSTAPMPALPHPAATAPAPSGGADPAAQPVAAQSSLTTAPESAATKIGGPAQPRNEPSDRPRRRDPSEPGAQHTDAERMPETALPQPLPGNPAPPPAAPPAPRQAVSRSGRAADAEPSAGPVGSAAPGPASAPDVAPPEKQALSADGAGAPPQATAAPVDAVALPAPSPAAVGGLGEVPNLAAALPSAPAGHVPSAPAPATSASPPLAPQLAPVLIQLSQTPGTHAVTVQLQPEELGRVEVHVGRGADGSAAVQVTADRPETLRMLVADQPALHHALDQAGVAPESRSLSFALSSPASGGFTSPDGGGSGGSGTPRRPPSTAALPDSGEDASDPAPSGRFVRAGVDITA